MGVKNKLKMAGHVILTLMICSGVRAQEGKFVIGLEGGPALVNMHTSDTSGPAVLAIPGRAKAKQQVKPIFRSTFGLTFQYDFNQRYGLRTGFSFEQKGCEEEGVLTNDSNDRYKARLNFNYLVIPAMFRINFAHRFIFFVQGGPYISYLYSQKQNTTLSMDTLREPLTGSHSFKKLYMPIDWGVTGGLGVSRWIGYHYNLSMEFRYALGLQNIHYKPLRDELNLSTRSAMLLFGFSYRIPSKQDRFRNKPRKF